MEVDTNTKQAIAEQAVKEIKESPDQIEDMWFDFSEGISVNIWLNDEGKIAVAAYPILDGEVDTSVWTEIPFNYNTLEEVLASGQTKSRDSTGIVLKKETDFQKSENGVISPKV